METIKNIVEILKQVRTETKSKVSDEIIFDNACKIYISNRINESRKNNGNKEREINNEKEIQLATDSQKWKLKKLGYKGNLNNLTKLNAMKLIQEHIK